jgi:hypothetical protein
MLSEYDSFSIELIHFHKVFSVTLIKYSFCFLKNSGSNIRHFTYRDSGEVVMTYIHYFSNFLFISLIFLAATKLTRPAVVIATTDNVSKTFAI